MLLLILCHIFKHLFLPVLNVVNLFNSSLDADLAGMFFFFLNSANNDSMIIVTYIFSCMYVDISVG